MQGAIQHELKLQDQASRRSTIERKNKIKYFDFTITARTYHSQRFWPGNKREWMVDFILIVYWVKCSFWRSFFWQSEGFDFWNPLFKRNNGVDLDCREMPLPTPPSSLRRPHWYGRRLAHISTQKLEHLDHSGIGGHTYLGRRGGGASDTHKAHHLGNWWRFPECSHMGCLMPRGCEGNSVFIGRLRTSSNDWLMKG